jgi:hypothetical protein
MNKPPDSTEWNLADLPQHRCAYLDAGYSFEGVAAMLAHDAEITRAWVEPFRTPPKSISPETRQICFQLRVSSRAYDLFFNAPDGLRGRYWQSPEIGDRATRHLLDTLNRKFSEHLVRMPASVRPPARPMLECDVCTSLEASSAKVWVNERDDSGNSKIDLSLPHQLRVARWIRNEADSCCTSTVSLWRWTPVDTIIEVKGALITPDEKECIPHGKINRARQIHLCGFS